MKKLTTLITASLLLSSAAFAGSVMNQNHTELSSASFQTKAEAYEAGFEIINNLNSMSNKELSKELPFYGETSVSDITINGTSVSVTEFATSPSDINYQAIVKVDYNFYSADQEE